MPIETTKGRPSCFIAMPVTTSEAHADLYRDVDHWNHVMESLFVPAIEAAGYVPWRPVAKGSHLIHAQIVSQLEQADMVLCDMSQNNPNVFFELGVRTSVNKPVALVRCDEQTPIPFDVSGINTHTYDPSLKAWHIGEEVKKLAAHLRDAESSCAGENPMWRQFGLVLKAQEPSAGGTREEAVLSVLSQQVSELNARMDAQDRATSPAKLADMSLRSAELLLTTGSIDLNDLVPSIAALADEFGQAVSVRFDAKKGVVVTELLPPNAMRHSFRAAVRDHLDAVAPGTGLHFVPSRLER